MAELKIIWLNLNDAARVHGFPSVVSLQAWVARYNRANPDNQIRRRTGRLHAADLEKAFAPEPLETLKRRGRIQERVPSART